MKIPVTPVPAEQPLLTRKILRSWLQSWSRRTTAYPVLLSVLGYVLFAGLLALVVFARSLALKLPAALAAGFVIGRLFIIGHDACHQSLTPQRTLNRWLGRVALLPSLTPYGLWEVGHNVVHHGYTNLKGLDFIWAPLTITEFRALSRPRRWLERAYPSGWVPGLYYMIEIWWRRVFFPARAAMPTRRLVFLRDCWLVALSGVCWLGMLGWAAITTGQSVIVLLVVGFAIPTLSWRWMIGFVVYLHHTHVGPDDRRGRHSIDSKSRSGIEDSREIVLSGDDACGIRLQPDHRRGYRDHLRVDQQPAQT